MAPRNILVTTPESAAPGFHIIDMSYSHIFPQGIAGTRMATFDLLALMYQMKRYFPAERCLAWLADYGLNEAAAERLMSALERYRPRRPWSHLRRGETDLRVAIARLRAPRNSGAGGSRSAGPPAASGT